MEYTDKDFENRRKMILSRIDKSKKGSIDEDLIPLLDKINSTKDYFTTSSCSGRIIFFKGDKKNEVDWLFVSHDPVKQWPEIEEEFFWVRIEPVIIHIACRSVEKANELLENARRICKKSSLLSINNKIMVEIEGSDYASTPLRKDLLSEDMKKFILEQFNEKLLSTKKQIKRLEKLFESM